MGWSWKDETRKDEDILDLLRSPKSRLRSLGRDKVFVRETERITDKLENAYSSDPQEVRDFFRHFRYPLGASRLSRARDFMRKLAEPSVRAALEEYLRYVARFKVVVSIGKKAPHFRIDSPGIYGPKFHVKMTKGHLRPLRASRDEVAAAGLSALLESETLQVPKALQEQLGPKGMATFVQIEDEDGTSVLSDLERLAYNLEGILSAPV